MSGSASAKAMAARWRGQGGRLEVWYATLSDPLSKVGLWVHHELVSPDSADPYVHGWAAAFREGQEPTLERFGPQDVDAAALAASNAPLGTSTSPLGTSNGPLGTSATVLPASTADAVIEPPCIRGKAGRLSWDLTYEDDDMPPIFTFPSWAWEKETLPGAQIVPVANTRFEGIIRVDDNDIALSAQTRGNVAHIYGHGSAERWGWLHADLGHGDTLEIVSAVSRMPGLNHLPPLSFVQLRTGARDWPRDPIAAAPLFRARLGLPKWQVRGTVGRWRLRVEVDIPESQSVAVAYKDPDGSTATCTNSEMANAEVVLEHRRSRWETEACWHLEGTAHAEIGTRP